MSASTSNAVLEQQLLLQLGDRLRRLRKARSLGTVELSRRVGISRTTLAAVEAGDPGPSMGTYMRVMAALGVAGDMALLAADNMGPSLSGSAAARSQRGRPSVHVVVSTDQSSHRAQDLQSLALHKEAVRLVKAHPELVHEAEGTLQRWIASGESRSMSLWTEWQDILRQGKWRKVLGTSRRAQELRQASPLTTVLPEEVRLRVLDEVKELKRGVSISNVEGNPA